MAIVRVLPQSRLQPLRESARLSTLQAQPISRRCAEHRHEQGEGRLHPALREEAVEDSLDMRLAKLLTDEIAHAVCLAEEAQQRTAALEPSDLHLIAKLVAVQPAAGCQHHAIPTVCGQLVGEPAC